MHVLAVEIRGFRGIRKTRLVLPANGALVGPNGSGKSTIVDALSLVFGRHKMVRELTEHDFTGSAPGETDRIHVTATIGGFSSDDPGEFPHWFRHGRAVEKWWSPQAATVADEQTQENSQLCFQMGFCARFDHEELVVEHLRYFQDSSSPSDPFLEESLSNVPLSLLRELGYFVLPTRRTWPTTLSFGSELFRRAIATAGGVPASSVLRQRDGLRDPPERFEEDPSIQPLVGGINERLAQLVGGKPRLQLRLTSTDSESLLQALVPHFEREDGLSLPASRHGMGLISLQTLVLLLEIGQARTQRGESFILALEEPELHVPPGLQRRLIGEAVGVSSQVLCTTHSPRVASFFDARSIQILVASSDERPGTELECRPLAPSSMADEPNSIVQLYSDSRAQLVEALMFPRVLVPEGRIDFEWLRRLLDVSETGQRPLSLGQRRVPPFGSVVGCVPTRDGAIKKTYQRLCALHPDVVTLVDGDSAGDSYVQEMLACSRPPRAIIQWPSGWAIEETVHWVLASAREEELLDDLNERLGWEFGSVDDVLHRLKNNDGRTGGLKAHYMAHEEIAGAMKASEPCVHRAEAVLEALTCAALAMPEESEAVAVDEDRSMEGALVYRLVL